jgi:hypothetical protein
MCVTRNLKIASIAAMGAFWSVAATASPVTITDTVDVHAFASGSPSNCCGFSASGWGDAVQDSTHPYNTDHIVFNRVDATHATIQLFTQYSGYESIGGGKAVHYADLFIDTGTPLAPGGVTYGIALGFQGGADGNGGFSTPGLYKITNQTLTTNSTNSQVKTSQDVWDSRSGWVIGGEFALQSDHAHTYLAPSVVTGGIDQGWSVSVNEVDPNGNSYTPGPSASVATSGLYALTVALTAPDVSSMNLVLNDFDIYWGTGDCDNDGIWGRVQAGLNISTTDLVGQVPEPSAILALLGGIALFRGRRFGKIWRAREDSNP